MKKFIISSLFALMMVFCLSSAACAEEYCALGSYKAGEELSCYIAMVSPDAMVSAEGLPAGLWLKESVGGDVKHLSLHGSSKMAGPVDFSVKVSEEPMLILCSLEILPEQPSVSISQDLSCSLNDHILLETRASVSDGGILSYQWFSGVGFAATPIEGATGSIYLPDTSVPGTQGYCCQVTNSNNGYTSSVMSEAVFVTVQEPKISGIFVDALPEKLSYQPGESLDTKGLRLKLSYENGSSAIIDNGFDISPAVFTQLGRQQVQLNYRGFVCSFYVTVSMDGQNVDGIGVLSLPDKTRYKLGESLDPSGLAIRVYTPAGAFDVSDGLEYSPKVLDKSGRQTITITYGGKTCSFTVSVEEESKATSVKLASLPIRREYTVGDTLDTSGLSLNVSDGHGSQIITQGFSCSPSLLSTPGTQTITVTYGEYSSQFSVTVREAVQSASPSPSPSASAKPETTPQQSPLPSAAPSVRPQHQPKDVSAMVKIIFAAAVLSLAFLAGYILWMQKRGKR